MLTRDDGVVTAKFTHLWINHQNLSGLLVDADERINYVRAFVNWNVIDCVLPETWTVFRPIAEVANDSRFVCNEKRKDSND